MLGVMLFPSLPMIELWPCAVESKVDNAQANERTHKIVVAEVISNHHHNVGRRRRTRCQHIEHQRDSAYPLHVMQVALQQLSLSVFPKKKVLSQVGPSVCLQCATSPALSAY